MDNESSQELTSSQTANNTSAESTLFTLMERYEDQLFRYAYFRTSNRTVALDLIQDVFTKVWHYLASGKTIEHEEAFLYRVTKNAIIDFFKKKKNSSLDALHEQGFDPESNDENLQHEKESDLSLIKELVKDLDEESRQIIFMRFSEERPIEEIAIVFNKTTNAMTVKIHRIVGKLRERYQYYGK